MYQEYISHHGITGMHWGQRNGPPYPLSRSAHNKVTQGGSNGKAISTSGSEAKKARPRRKIKPLDRLKKAISKIFNKKPKVTDSTTMGGLFFKSKKQKAMSKPIDPAEARAKAIASGSASEVAKYMKTLTKEERKDVLDRFKDEASIIEYASKEKVPQKTTLDRIDDASKKVERVATIASRGVKAWNTFVPIINTIADTELPMIKTKEQNQQNQQNQNQQNQQNQRNQQNQQNQQNQNQQNQRRRR